MNVWLEPQLTWTFPAGLIVPPGPAAVMIVYYGELAKLAVIVWGPPPVMV
jgi:hypothetical protein